MRRLRWWSWLARRLRLCSCGQLCRQPDAGRQLVQLEVRAEEDGTLVGSGLALDLADRHAALPQRVLRLHLGAGVLVTDHEPGQPLRQLVLDVPRSRVA